MNKYTKHELTQMPLSQKTGWSKLTWKSKGRTYTELVKYPKRYMERLWEAGIESIEEVIHYEKTWTNPYV